jgi:PKD repeat protein
MKTSDIGRSQGCEHTSTRSGMHGILRSIGMLSLLLLTFAAGMASMQPAFAAESPPSYELTYLGVGSPAAINKNGTVAGARLNGVNYEPLVSIGGSTWSPLPIPSGAQSVFPTGINDNDVIVGVSYTAWVARAVRWTPGARGTYTVELLPLLPGSTSSYATDINNLGQVIGSRSTMGYTPQGTGWVYSDSAGLVDLYATHGLAVIPTAINDNGLILAGIELLDLKTGTVSIIGGGPDNYDPVTAIAINNDGMMAGYAALRSSSLKIISVFFNDGNNGWKFIAGSSQWTTASSINSLGDVGYGEQGAGIYLNGIGVFGLNSLLSSTTTSAGWVITGNGVKVNDLRQVATLGRNSITGQTGGVLLTPTGTAVVQPPAPPPAPAPLLSVSQTSGTAPLTVNFTSSASTVPGGSLISFISMDYGDGSGNQVIGSYVGGTASVNRTSSHTYIAAGTYTARLTVNYLDASRSTATTTITVNPVALAPALRSTAIDLTAKLSRSKVSVSGKVVVQNSSGGAGAGAVISATWTIPGGGTKTQTLTTNTAGTATFSASGNRGTYTLKVNGISKTGYSFDSANSVLSKSITR